jgi:hypothetical protein
MTGGANGAGITCSIDSAGTIENPAERRSVTSREIPTGTVTSM